MYSVENITVQGSPMEVLVFQPEGAGPAWAQGRLIWINKYYICLPPRTQFGFNETYQ